MYHGKVKNRAVVPDPPVDLPDGTEVVVETAPGRRRDKCVGTIREAEAGGMTKFSDSGKVLFPDCAACGRYAHPQMRPLSEGMPIPSDDLWIAAQALRHEPVLVTSDEHFRAVPHPGIENWAG